MGAIQRFYKYIDYKGIKPTRFEKEAGISNGYLSTQLKRNGRLGEEILNTIIDNCLDMNPIWLLTGKGEMLLAKEGQNANYGIPYNNIPIAKDPVANGYCRDNGIGIPLLTDANATKYESVLDVVDELSNEEFYRIPDLSNADFLIRVKDNSMYPKLTSGDVVACRILKESRFIQWNKVHAVITNEQGVLVKRLKEGVNNSVFRVVSENIEYEPFDIPKEEIRDLAVVVGVVHFE